MRNEPEVIDLSCVAAVSGGANQSELRTMAQRWCPATYGKYKHLPILTRPMGEQCLDEAGLGAYKSRLDKYFPRGGGK